MKKRRLSTKRRSTTDTQPPKWSIKGALANWPWLRWPRRVWAVVAARWHRLSKFQRHWLQCIVIGVAINLLVHAGQAEHVSAVVNFQNAGWDALNRVTVQFCKPEFWGSKVLRDQDSPDECIAVATPKQRPPLLVEVDDALWRSTEWGGGEPVRAPRDKLLMLIENIFSAGAAQVVLDVLIEDQIAPVASADETRVSSRLRAALADEDNTFAEGLSRLTNSGVIGPDKRLILVRSTREPLVSGGHLDASAFKPPPDLRRSRALDSVIAASNGRIQIAAPYFEAGGDGITRDWLLFSSICEHAGTDASLRGEIRVLPSVQLLVLANQQQQAGALSLASASAPAAAVTARSGGVPCSAARSIETSNGSYWTAVQTAFANAKTPVQLGDAARQGDIANRIVFRFPQNFIERMPATLLLVAGQADYSKVLGGRVVVLGQTFNESKDFFETPHQRMAGAELLVNAIDSMVQFQLLRPPSPWVTFGMALLLIIVVGYVYARWDSATGAYVSIALVLLVAGGASFFYFAHGVWLDVAAPILAIQIHRAIAAMEESYHLKRLRKKYEARH